MDWYSQSALHVQDGNVRSVHDVRQFSEYAAERLTAPMVSIREVVVTWLRNTAASTILHPSQT
jgi:hypothetical protein